MEQQRIVPASQTAIENLARQIISIDQVTSGNAICAICTDLMPVGEAARQLPCNHLYHSHCIIEWLNRRNNCPLCRYKLPTDGHQHIVPAFFEVINELQHTVPASQRAIENLPTHVISVDQVTIGNVVCIICTNIMPVGEAVKQLPCTHLCHSHCIIEWFNFRNTCPLCRSVLPTD